MSSNSGTGDAHLNQVLGGYKATLKNENASDDAKQHAREVLDEHGASAEPLPQSRKNPNADPERVKAGYKATLHNPNTSDDAKQKAEEVLEGSE
ncbi:conidiation-specific protein 6 [Moniliophthora roreri MCA 2997]|uniref:Conidiation-specific protein 6 n=2 Tax=Moniliophthora roreri TaxID=221103 RepID=V2XX57_MONRO|nr:conidiation-specific protein 6 [Moniliophthora roreri MCA 2997]KAI3622192.1 conidiation-specific protein 6 [Moniliophthora roreri]